MAQIARDEALYNEIKVGTTKDPYSLDGDRPVGNKEKIMAAAERVTDLDVLGETIIQACAAGYLIPRELFACFDGNTRVLDQILHHSAHYLHSDSNQFDGSFSNLQSIFLQKSYSPSNNVFFQAMDGIVQFPALKGQHLELMALKANGMQMEVEDVITGEIRVLPLIDTPTSDGTTLLMKVAKHSHQAALSLFKNGGLIQA